MSQHPIFTGDMLEIVESFVVETREIFDDLDNQLLELEHHAGDKALVDKIFRAVHTVKGTSGFLSLEQLSVLAHHFEDVLNKLRRDELTLRNGMIDVMLAAFDQMKVLLQQVVDQRIEPLDMDAVIADLTAISEGTFVAHRQPDAPLTAAIQETQADQPARMEMPEPATAPDLPAVEPEREETKPNMAAPASQDDQEALDVDRSLPSAEASSAGADPEAARRKTDRATETIRVEVGRLDNLMNLVGELVLGRNRLMQVVSEVNDQRSMEDILRELSDTTAQVDFITTELQSAIMRTRMVQIGRVFNKFPRLVRDLGKEFNKKINLVIEGEETELDKSLIEEIGDPLVHLIRNAADHGVEQPEIRSASGKPAHGTIRLGAAHEGNHIVVEVEDDGAGMDPEKLKQSAVDKKLITKKEAADMSDAEAFSIIFRPGFSTAKQVSQVSGRGVGMDVVKTNITRLNGTVSIDSRHGKGTRFTLKLPLTLAIIQSLLVRLGEETFAVPLHSVIEVVGLKPGDISTIRGREVIRLREQVLPLLDVGKALNAQNCRATSRAYAVIVAIAHYRVGLIVDDLIGQKEIVIKPLGSYLKKIPGVAGSTILGDGRVILIADVAELVRMENEKLRGLTV